MRNFKDTTTKNSIFFLELITAIEPRAVDWDVVKRCVAKFPTFPMRGSLRACQEGGTALAAKCVSCFPNPVPDCSLLCGYILQNRHA
jgi:hypothetical protein